MTTKKNPRAWTIEFLNKSMVPYNEDTVLRKGTAALIAAAFRIEFRAEPVYDLPVTVRSLIKAFERAIESKN